MNYVVYHRLTAIVLISPGYQLLWFFLQDQDRLSKAGKNIYDRAGDKVNSNRAGTGILFKIRAFGEESDKISAHMMFLRCIEK